VVALNLRLYHHARAATRAQHVRDVGALTAGAARWRPRTRIPPCFPWRGPRT